MPSDGFNQELDSDAEVKSFCQIKYGIDMPMSETMSVKGREAHQFFKDVKTHSGFTPQWNFNKVLIGHDGKVVGTWGGSLSRCQLSSLKLLKTSIQCLNRLGSNAPMNSEIRFLMFWVKLKSDYHW